jgi:Flp pilus assembly protein TadD
VPLRYVTTADNKDLDALNNLAVCLAKVGKLEEAIGHLSRAHQHHGDDSVVLYNRAILYIMTGNYSQALPFPSR